MAVQLPQSTVPFKSSFRPLSNDLLQGLWSTLFHVGSFYLWGFELPYRLALAATSFAQDIVPALGIVHKVAYNLSYSVYEWTLPLRNLVESVVHSFFEFADNLFVYGWESALQAPQGTIKHFQVAFEAYMHLIHEKTEIIEKHGPAGIPLVFSPKAAKAA